MLIDTYDTLNSGLKNSIKAFKNNNIDDNYKGIFGVRIDSGDLSEYANMCKKELENSGLKNAKIILTGGLNEDKIRKMVKENVKVDIFGVGDAISLPENKISLVYKMSKINNQNVMKLSNNKNKMSYPGDKNIYRIEDEYDFIDYIELEENIESNKKENKRKKKKKYIENGEKNISNCRLLFMVCSSFYF